MKYLIKTGWILNPNPKVVNNITAAIERNQGHCPCHNPDSGTDKDNDLVGHIRKMIHAIVTYTSKSQTNDKIRRL